MLDRIKIILIEPQHPGNIGAVARVMANMGLNQLCMVNPLEFPHPAASARAAGADPILDHAKIVDNFDAAISDCSMVFGTTARFRRISWPIMSPRVAMQALIEHAGQQAGNIAICFGRERNGMLNEELERCFSVIRVPVDEQFASLNLGTAVAIMLYELRASLIETGQLHVDTQDSEDPIASAAMLRGYYEHLESVLHTLEFFDGRSTKLMRKLTRLYNRAQPTEVEINILRGILAATERMLKQRAEQQRK